MRAHNCNGQRRSTPRGAVQVQRSIFSKALARICKEGDAAQATARGLLSRVLADSSLRQCTHRVSGARRCFRTGTTN
jgi:hypothetical protein